jgi:uncharacterized membrane protein YfcA
LNVTATSFKYLSPWLLFFTTAWILIFIFAFPDPAALFAKNWPLIFVGVAGAIIGNMTAIGGGIIFIPVMMFVYHLDPVSSLKLAFISQASGMTSGAVGWIQRKEVPFQLLKWTVPALILGTIISTFLIHPNALLVKSLFGPVSFLVGVLTIVMLKRKGHLEMLPQKAMVPVFIISLIGGMVTGWVAIGEGEIIAAFCMLAYGLNANKAVGLGVTLLSVISILLAGIHTFYFGGIPWDMAIFTALGCLWGGRLGPYIALGVSSKKVKLIFACIAILDGSLIIFQVLRSHFWK